MTNKEFLVEVQKSCQLDMPTCLSLMGSLQKMLAKAAVDQVPVYLQGLGVFNSHKHPEYVQENRQTGVMILYPPRITFRMQGGEFEDVETGAHLLAEYAKIPEAQANRFIDAIVATIQSQLPSGDEIEVPGIGIFQNIMTHHSDMQHVAYVPSDQMKELVNAPFSCFEPVVIGKKEKKDDTIVESQKEKVAEEKLQTEGLMIPILPESEEDKAPEIKEEIKSESKEEIIEPKEEVIEPKEEERLPEPKELPVKNNPVLEPIKNDKMSDKYYMEDDKSEENESSGNNKLLYVALAVVLAACGGLLWLIFGDSNDGDIWENTPEAVVVEPAPKTEEDPVLELAPEDTMALEDEISEAYEAEFASKDEPAAEETAPVAETKPAEPVKTVADNSGLHRMMGADGKPVTVVLNQGERLTLIAEKHFGNKAFWPYIFDANSDKLKSPNQVQAGMKLYLPDPAHYGIDAKSAESIRKANNRGAQLLK